MSEDTEREEVLGETTTTTTTTQEEEQSRFANSTTSANIEDVTNMLKQSEKYREEINKLISAPAAQKEPVLQIDANTLGEEYYAALKDAPIEMIDVTNTAVREFFVELHPYNPKRELQERRFVNQIAVELRGYPPQYTIGKEDVSRYICVEGKITAVEQHQMILTRFKWKCTNCQTRGIQENEPSKCESCGSKKLIFEYDQDNLEDQRWVQLTILPDQSYGLAEPDKNAQPKLLMVDLREHMARRNDFSYCTNVAIHGVVKVGEPARLKDFIKDVPAMYLYLHANCIDLTDDTRMKLAATQSAEAIEVNDTDLKAIENFKQELDNDEDRIIDVLSRSFAPSIRGKEFLPIKESMLYQSVGGYNSISSNTTILSSDYDQARKFINILLIGNPSSGKSTLLYFLLKLAGGIYATGEGLTPAGAGAGITTDSNVGKSVIAGGLGVTGNGKVKIIDEMDKIRNQNKLAVYHQLNTMMESGFFVLSGIQKATLPATGPWSFGLNPSDKGEWNPNLTFLENADIPSYLANRLDGIWLTHDPTEELILDPKQKLEKEKIKLQEDELKLDTADAVLLGETLTHDVGEDDSLITLVEMSFLAKWVKVARNTQLKQIDKQVLKPLHDFFIRMKKPAEERGIRLEMRNYYSLVRFAFARARFCHRDHLVPRDVQRSIELAKEQWKRLGVNVDAGTYKTLDLYDNRKRSSLDKVLANIVDILLEGSEKKTVTKAEVIMAMRTSQKWSDEHSAAAFFQNAIDNGYFLEIEPDVYKKVRELTT